MDRLDLFVVGGGSAGLKAARTAAKLGARVGLAEEVELGGECAWAGCIPTKAMVRAADVWQLIRHAHEFGLELGQVRGDFSGAMAYKHRKVMQVESGPADAGLSKIGVRYWNDHAEILDAHTIRVSGESIRFDRLIVATGTTPWIPDIPGLREAGFITNREAVNLDRLPQKLVVLGAGPIGLEFAQIFRRFGAEVTVIERGSHILPAEDVEIADYAEERLRAEGIRFVKQSQVSSLSGTGTQKQVQLSTPDGDQTLDANEILVATGRATAAGGLGLEAAGVEYTLRSITTNNCLQTNQPHIWTAGDANGGYLFTHVASYEGKLAAENAFSDTPKELDLRVVPRATFTDPEIASVGMTEGAARLHGEDIAIYRFDFSHLDRAILHGDEDGFVKLVADRKSGQILGGHIIGQQASSLIAEIALAMRHNLPVSAIADTIHAYPTFPEAVEAAALSAPQ